MAHVSIQQGVAHHRNMGMLAPSLGLRVCTSAPLTAVALILAFASTGVAMADTRAEAPCPSVISPLPVERV